MFRRHFDFPLRAFVFGLSVCAGAFPSAAQSLQERQNAKPSNVERVWFREYWPVLMRPGTTRQMELVTVVGGGIYDTEPVKGVDVRWTVEPRNHSVTIDRKGLLKVSADVSSLELIVYANLNNGARIISLPVHVAMPGLNPFQYGSSWRQTGRIPCDGTADHAVQGGVEELSFLADGTYMVTWIPFETYHDYWGPYTFDLKRKRLTLGVTFGNYVPTDVHGEGTFEFVPDGPIESRSGRHYQKTELRLKGIHLGTPPTRKFATKATPCGMVFTGVREVP